VAKCGGCDHGRPGSVLSLGSTPWGALAIIGTCWLAEGIVGRRAPNVVRREETICRSHERALHRVRGLSPGEIAALTVVEHGQLEPGDVGRELRRWEALAGRGWPGSDPCGIPQCCGPGPRGVLEQAIGYLWTSPSRTASASHRAAASTRCIPSGVLSPANSASVHPFLRSRADTRPQKIGMSPQPGLPAEERRGDHPGEHVIKPGQPPRGINLPYPGRNGRIAVNKGSHIPMITMRPPSRHTATPTLTKCCCPTSRRIRP
jgi:hypothetical protein